MLNRIKIVKGQCSFHADAHSMFSVGGRVSLGDSFRMEKIKLVTCSCSLIISMWASQLPVLPTLRKHVMPVRYLKVLMDADVITNAVMTERLKEVFKNHDATVTHEAGTKMAHDIRKML